jgi:hypothetical protein
MTHQEMIEKLEVGMTLDAGAVKSKIVKIDKKYTDANKIDIYALEITNEQGQKIGSQQLHDLVVTRGVIKIEGI